MSIDPSKKASAFEANTSKFYRVDALKGGTDKMRLANSALLPKAYEETPENYATRLGAATLVNFYNKAIDNAVGRAFAKELVVSGLPPELEPLLRDIDGSGSTIDQFAQESLWNAIHHGTNYIVADYPHIDVLPTNLAEQRKLKARPYLLTIEAPQVLAAYARIDNGQERLSHFRWIFKETVPSADGLTEKSVDVVKAYNQPTPFDAVTLTTWKNDENGGWTQDGEPLPIIGVEEIPVVCPYGWRTGFFVGRPVLNDLADLNIAHWVSLSEQINILSVARVPFLHVAGDNLRETVVDEEGRDVSRPYELSIHAAAITGAGTTIKWVESSGSAAKLGQEQIEYLEAKMAEMSLTMSTSAPGDATATATAINAAEAHSVLKGITLSFSQALTKALFFVTQFAGKPADKVLVEFDTTVEVPTQKEEPTKDGKSSGDVSEDDEEIEKVD